MHPASSPSFPQPNQQKGSSSEFHDELSDSHGGEISVPSTSQQTLPDITDPSWTRLVLGPLAVPERISLIMAILSNQDEVGKVRRLCGDDAQAFIDVVYETLDGFDQASRMSCLRLLCKICGFRALLPKPLAVEVFYDRTQDPVYHGGFGDVWKGISGGLEVAVKVIRSYQSSDQGEVRKRFCKEVVTWSALRHPNVLQLRGATVVGDRFEMVSEWMENGNINEFLKANPDANRLGLLGDVGKGVEYLHDEGMIHGDLKGDNILIKHDGRACIADFGLLAIIPDGANFISTISHLEGGTFRWMSPELLNPEPFGLTDSRPTEQSDCYALGMVIYEVLSGQGGRPERPLETRAAWFTDDIWRMLELCWKHQPHDRPGLKALLQCLEGAELTPLLPSSIATDEGVAADNPSDRTVTNPGLIPATPTAPGVKQHGGFDLDEPPIPHLDRTAILPVIPTIPLSSIPGFLLSLPNAKQFETGNFDLDEMIKTLTEALVDESLWNEILHLTGGTAEFVIGCLDKVISSDTFRTNSDILTRSRAFSTISRLSRGCKYLPPSYGIDAETITFPGEPCAYGGSAEVYRGTRDDRSVAVKVLRPLDQECPTKLKERLCKEAILWKHMSCRYILKFDGVFYHEDVPAIVTPWMPHGSITDYLEKHPHARRLPLLLGVVKGVKYLHNHDIAHGGIETSNILISGSTSPQPLLADFGSVRSTTTPVEISSEAQGTPYFMAPELLLPTKFGLEKGVPSKEADVYALGMTVYRVLAGKLPFLPRRGTEVIHAVTSGERPHKPENAEGVGMTEVVWDLLRECWKEDRTARPTINHVLKKFRRITTESETADSTIQGFLAAQSNTRNRASVFSQNSSLTVVSSSSVYSSPSQYYSLDQGESDEPEGADRTGDDQTDGLNSPMTRTNPLTEGPRTENRGISGSSIAGSMPSAHPPVFETREPPVGRIKQFWDRVTMTVPLLRDSTGRKGREAFR